MVTCPGRALARATNSANDLTGVFGATVSTIGASWIAPTATRSLNGSYGGFLYTAGPAVMVALEPSTSV